MRRKGFTLVEVLIVVVIIAILASLIVPRMLMQTEKAKAAEGFMMFGVIKRAAERYQDLHGSILVPPSDPAYIIADAGNIFGQGVSVGDWSTLDITGPEKSKNFSFWYSGALDYYSIVVQGTDTPFYIGYTVYLDDWAGPPTYACDEVILTNDGQTTGDYSKPCRLK